MKKTFNFLLLLFLWIAFSFSHVATAQPSSSESQSEQVFKSIAKYTSGGFDKTTQLLEKYGYNPPSYLQKEWAQYPSVRKIEMAYEAAEKSQRGVGGEKLLALLSKDLSQRYEAAKYEEALKPLIERNTELSKIAFKHPSKYGQIELHQNLKNQILSISKYTESGALGGTRGVLKHKFGLADNDVYDILRNSNSSQEALERGLAKSSVPPPPEERISNISQELQNKYEGAKYDKNLQKIASGKEPINETPQRSKVSEPFLKKTDSDSKIQKIEEAYSKTKYNSFEQTHYHEPNTRKFGSMITNSRGFGGVIFGSPIEDKTNLPKLKHLKYIPSEMLSVDSTAMGTLEFTFEDGTEIVESGVNLEDIIAANEIVFGEYSDFVEGEGIGLAGIHTGSSFLNYTRCEAIIHPSLRHFELGWACLLTDVLPMAKGDIYARLKTQEDSLSVSEWYSRNWKVTDVPLSISSKNNNLVFSRTDKAEFKQLKNIFIKMESVCCGEDTLFYNLTPLLISHIEEYHRLNEFSKILSLFRWAKVKGGKFVNPPQSTKLLFSSPEAIYIDEENKKVKYFTSLEEKELLSSELNKNVDSLKQFMKRIESNKLLDSINNIFLGKVNNYRKIASNTWDILLNPIDKKNEICSFRIDDAIERRYYLEFQNYDDEAYRNYKKWQDIVYQIFKLSETQNEIFFSYKERYCNDYVVNLNISIASTSNKESILLSFNNTLEEVFSKIESMKNENKKDWVFMKNGKILNINRTIDELHIKSGDLITMKKK